ncbi:hypothetical protein BDR03DRAFT_982316 [Suillus americanus]|nr:hypothetical protein BDR03DRAFT_982316 [Suillus americanus]
MAGTVKMQHRPPSTSETSESEVHLRLGVPDSVNCTIPPNTRVPTTTTIIPILGPARVKIDAHGQCTIRRLYNTQLVLGATACVGAIGMIIGAYLRKSRLPPSPPTWRLRGHFLPPLNASLTVARWIDEYGPLVTIRSGIQTIVIIGRYKAAVDIMEKQGKVLADRPRLAAGEIVTRGLDIVLAHAGDRFRRMRRAISRDPEVYPEPDAFKPQRWIDGQGGLRDDLSFFVFGFGRRSVFINSLLILWAFQLSLDPTKPQDDMGFTTATMPNVPCAIEFQTRVPEVELRHILQNYPEAG